MANSNSIHLATDTVQKINSIKQSLRNMASSCNRQLGEIDSLIKNPEKKTILVDGLEGISVDSNDLKTEKDGLQGVCQYILANIVELTS